MPITRPPVKTKADFVKRYRAGEFGNHSPTWDTLEEYLASGYRGLVHIRNRVAGGPTWYNVPAEEVEGRVGIITAPFFNGSPEPLEKRENLYFSGMAPTEKTLIQGEVMRSTRHLEFFYSTVAKPMRDALTEKSDTIYGAAAAAVLRRYLCPNSFEWLGYLLDTYPGHVVELSTYDVEWGTLPGYNTVFWEVRSY